MGNYLMIWPKSKEVTHINYHYTQLGECADYLNYYFPNQIKIIDGDVEPETEIEKFIGDHEVEKAIIQVNYENAENAFEVAERIKRIKNIPIMAYGNITTMYPQFFKNSVFDAIFKDRDPEISMKSFLRYYDENKPVEQLQKELMGTSIVKDEKLIETQPGKFISEERWGMSREELVPIEKYDNVKGKNRYLINISRGCPFGCEHCLVQLTEGNIERRRSIKNLKETLNQIKDKYKHIKIWAANFTLDEKYVMEFCKMMEEDFPELTWECATRIDLVDNKEMLAQMAKAGCKQISVGIESLNNRELIHTKDFQKNQISEQIHKMQEPGIAVKACIMVGMPNQTKEEIIETLEFLEEENVTPRINVYTPFHSLYNCSLKELGNLNRKTYKNCNVKGISSDELIQLSKNSKDWRKILGVEKEKKLGNAKI